MGVDTAITTAPVLRAHSLCAKCGERERVKGHSYCLECWREYMRSYRRTSAEASETKHFRRGAETMRRALLVLFVKIGRAEMNGNAAAEIVRQAQLEL